MKVKAKDITEMYTELMNGYKFSDIEIICTSYKNFLVKANKEVCVIKDYHTGIVYEMQIKKNNRYMTLKEFKETIYRLSEGYIK